MPFTEAQKKPLIYVERIFWFLPVQEAEKPVYLLSVYVNWSPMIKFPSIISWL